MSTQAELIKNGASFEELVHLHLKQIGYFGHMGGEGSNVKPYLRHYDSSTFQKDLKNAEKKLAIVSKKKTKAEIAKIELELDREYQKRVKGIAKSLSEGVNLRGKIEVMLEKAIVFQSPSPAHDDFKADLISSLKRSIKQDCMVEYYTEELMELKKKTVKSFIAEQIREAKEEIRDLRAEHKEHLREETESVEWTNMLCDTLGIERIK